MTTTTNAARSTILGSRVWASGLKPDQLIAVLALDQFHRRVKQNTCLSDHEEELTLSAKVYDWFFCQFLDYLSKARRERIYPQYYIKERQEGDTEDSLRLTYYKPETGQHFQLYVKQSA